ncbi:MAG: DUF4062 domain-containing protein, partial [Aggregatilineales bacterium]
MNTVYNLKFFISSPGDLAAERRIACRVIEELGESEAYRQRCRLTSLAYENEVPPIIGMPPQAVVDDYMLPDACDIVICMLWSRMGTSFEHEGEWYLSGTHYEFTRAYNAFLNRGKPILLLYHGKKPLPYGVDGSQVE